MSMGSRARWSRRQLCCCEHADPQSLRECNEKRGFWKLQPSSGSGHSPNGNSLDPSGADPQRMRLRTGDVVGWTQDKHTNSG